VISNQIYIEKEGLPASLRNRIIRLAAFQNPEFYKAQAMHFSTFGKPRMISCCEEYPKHLALPRGCQEELLQMLDELKIKAKLIDERVIGNSIDVKFQGTLHPEQQRAADQLIKHDIGVLSASTAFGKTVIGAWLIAQKKSKHPGNCSSKTINGSMGRKPPIFFRIGEKGYRADWGRET